MTATQIARGPGLAKLRDSLHHAGVQVRKVLLGATLAVVLGVVAAPVVLVALGYRPTMVKADSMAPSLARGDLIVNEYVSPATVRVGDVITFSDTSRGGATFTERVVDAHPFGAVYAFTSQAESTAGTHSWSVDRGDQVERIAYKVPGHPLELASSLAVQGGLILTAGASLVVAAMRRM